MFIYLNIFNHNKFQDSELIGGSINVATLGVRAVTMVVLLVVGN
jgi:hypothetical protein